MLWCKATVLRGGSSSLWSMSKLGGKAAILWASPAEWPIHLCKRASDAVQALGKHFRVHAHTDSEVVRHFEEAARDSRGFEFHSQPFEKRIGVTFPQAYK